MRKDAMISITGPAIIKFCEYGGGYVSLAFEAPKTTRIFRIDENGQVIGAQSKKLDNADKKPQIK